MKQRFDLIIFDWDGTLVDSIDWIVHCIQRAAEHYGCPVPTSDAAKDIIGLSLDNAVKTLFPNANADTREKLAAHYGQNFFSKETGPDDLFPGVPDMLKQLKGQGYRLAIATGKKSPGLARAIAGTGVADLFCTTRCSDQTASKPNPLMIDEIVSEMAVTKQRTLMVGDSVHDMQMALNAQVASVAVTCGAHSEAQLRQYKPLYCLSRPTELLGII
ncbi:MAG: HAD family hydrolase [Gammaproteobacteria bacterium]